MQLLTFQTICRSETHLTIFETHSAYVQAVHFLYGASSLSTRPNEGLITGLINSYKLKP